MLNRPLTGAIAGIVATYAMTAALAAMKRRIPSERGDQLPPRSVTEGALRALPDDMPWKDLSLAAHFGFGAAAGALYASAAKPGLDRGLAYGLAVWTASYFGWVPAAGIMPPAHRQPPLRNAMMIAAHLVWGGSLDAVARHLQASENVLSRPAPAARRAPLPAANRKASVRRAIAQS